MDLIFKFIGLALIITIAVIVVKQWKPELAVLVGVTGSVVMFFYIIEMLQEVYGLFTMLLDSTHIDPELFIILLKIVGIGYLTEFGANICSDSGNSAIASKILLAGKLAIFILAIPIIKNLISLLASIMV